MHLIPTDEHFYTLFERLAARLTASAKMLDDLFTNVGRTAELIASINSVEHEADTIQHEIVTRIDRSFITPFDREDIHSLATRLDNVVDLIEESARRIELFQITSVPPAAQQLAVTIRRACEHLESAVIELRQGDVRGDFSTHIAAVKQEEETADALYQEAVGALFAAPTDALHLIKWKEIYDKLEEATDECQHAAQVVQSVALKHA